MFIFSTITCLLFQTLAVLASNSNTNSSLPSPTAGASCTLSEGWRKNVRPFVFDPTQNCRGLNDILSVVNQDHTFNFCAADPDVVARYIKSGLRAAVTPSVLPRPCEVHQWYYHDYGGKLNQSFCQNATRIAIKVDTSKKPGPAQTQPYQTVIHSARVLCLQKFKADLESIGDPDIAGIGVLSSEIFGMLLLVIFHLAALSCKRSELPARLLKTTRYFYATATLLAFSIVVAAPITFWQRRSKTDSLYSDFGYFNFYANIMLALAPPLSIIPAVVLVMMPPNVQDSKSGERINVWDKEGAGDYKLHHARLTVSILYFLCIAVTWMTWVVGVRGQHYPTRVVFGGGKNIDVSPFLYKHSSSYILSVCIVMIALPILFLVVWAALCAWHGKTRRNRSLSLFRDRCRDICILFGISQLIMFAYIRGQAIEQADGETSETDWGFGQILIMFTWVPLLFTIKAKVGEELMRYILTLKSSAFKLGVDWLHIAWGGVKDISGWSFNYLKSCTNSA